MTDKNFPKVVVGALIYNDKNEIFLGKSYKWGENWIIPGGHLEWGEKLSDCVKREVKEETDLDVENIELVGIQESIFSKEFHKKKHMVFMDYCCQTKSDDVELNDEIQEYVWIDSKDALKNYQLAEATKEFIEKFIKFKNL